MYIRFVKNQFCYFVALFKILPDRVLQKSIHRVCCSGGNGNEILLPDDNFPCISFFQLEYNGWRSEPFPGMFWNAFDLSDACARTRSSSSTLFRRFYLKLLHSYFLYGSKTLCSLFRFFNMRLSNCSIKSKVKKITPFFFHRRFPKLS